MVRVVAAEFKAAELNEPRPPVGVRRSPLDVPRLIAANLLAFSPL